MIKNKTKWFLIIFLLLITIVIIFSKLKEFDLSQAKITDITFSANHNLLHGPLVLPKNIDSPPPIALNFIGNWIQKVTQKSKKIATIQRTSN